MNQLPLLVIFRCLASCLFLASHALLIFNHLVFGVALHGLGEVLLAPWVLQQRAWDLVLIAVVFLFLDVWGTFQINSI